MTLAPQQERAVQTRLKLLDAAVDELLEHGYARLTTSAVATRAGVSRGAQQRYFPHKDVLVAEAVRHLISRAHAELRSAIEAVPQGPARLERALDVVFRLYTGPLFASFVELSFAARAEPALAAVVRDEERSISRALDDAPSELFGEALTSLPDFPRRWASAVATARGLALLRLFGHSASSVEAQWKFTRRGLLQMLTAPDGS